MEEIGRPFAAPAGTAVRVPHSLGETWIVIAVLGVWLCGFIVCVLCWFRFWRDVRGALRGARHLDLGLPIPVVSAPTNFEPGVFGIFRPVMLLPEGIAEWLAPEQLDAIVAHELSHVRRGDNLTAAIHMGVEAIFWFHPLVWLIRGRLTEERETACDEEVLGAGNDPDSYAESILNACRYIPGVAARLCIRCDRGRSQETYRAHRRAQDRHPVELCGKISPGSRRGYGYSRAFRSWAG